MRSDRSANPVKLPMVIGRVKDWVFDQRRSRRSSPNTGINSGHRLPAQAGDYRLIVTDFARRSGLGTRRRNGTAFEGEQVFNLLGPRSQVENLCYLRDGHRLKTCAT